jgi:hypothetical protein
MPVRKLNKTYSRSVSGVKYAEKASHQVGFESTLERDFIYLLEFDYNVEYFEEQPVKIEYLDTNNTLRNYTPDFYVRYVDYTEPAAWFRPMLFEIKYRDDLWKNWKEYKPKFQAAIRFAAQKGWRFKILTEKEIRTEYLANAKFLLGYRKNQTETGMINTLLDTVKELRVTTPSEIIAAASIDKKRRAQLLHVLWHLISTEVIGCNFNDKITMSSEIWSLDTEKPKFILP